MNKILLIVCMVISCTFIGYVKANPTSDIMIHGVYYSMLEKLDDYSGKVLVTINKRPPQEYNHVRSSLENHKKDPNRIILFSFK